MERRIEEKNSNTNRLTRQYGPCGSWRGAGSGEAGSRQFADEKPLITPSPFDGKKSRWDYYPIHFKLIAEFNDRDTSAAAIFHVAGLP